MAAIISIRVTETIAAIMPIFSAEFDSFVVCVVDAVAVITNVFVLLVIEYFVSLMETSL